MHHVMHAVPITAKISPKVLQNPATGEPRRTESTSARGNVIRQLSHSSGRANGTPEMESGSTTTPCTW